MLSLRRQSARTHRTFDMTNPADAKAPSPGPRLLLVEDNPSTMRLLQLMLADEYDVDSARGVDESLYMARERHYDIFVLDVNLSERRTGIEVLHALRRMHEYARAPVVACTAYALRDHQSLFQEAGFSEILAKPITRRNLLEGITTAIENPIPEPASEERIYEAMELSPMPTSISEVLELIARNGRKETDFEKLITVVNHDQVISTWLICRANSAFFKLNADIDSIEQAIQYMGFRPVCNLLLSKLLTQRFADFETDRETSVYEYIMQVGLGAAYLARALAERIAHPHPEIAYSAVLLCQLGRLLLLDDRRERYADLWYDEGGAFAGPPPIGQETLFLSANYVTLGAEVGRRNNFSETLLNVMRYHHRPDEALDDEQQLLTFLVATGLETYATMRDKDMSELLSVLLESYPLEGCAELSGVDRRDLMSAIRELLEEARAFVDEVLTEDSTEGHSTSHIAA